MTYRAATAIALALAMAAQAQARELSKADLQTISDINTSVNHDPQLNRISARDPSCGAYAVNKAYLLTTHGFGRDPVALGIVMIPGGAQHAVAEVKGNDTTYVLDSLHGQVETRQELEHRGYIWMQEYWR